MNTHSAVCVRSSLEHTCAFVRTYRHQPYACVRVRCSKVKSTDFLIILLYSKQYTHTLRV